MPTSNLYNGSSYARRLATTLRNAYEVHDRDAFDKAIARMVETMEYTGPRPPEPHQLHEHEQVAPTPAPAGWTGPERRHRSGAGSSAAMQAHLSDLARIARESPSPLCEASWPGAEARDAIDRQMEGNRVRGCTRKLGDCECKTPMDRATCMYRAVIDKQPYEQCRRQGGCVCGGDTPGVRAGCSQWRGD
jgi:hypothetical protein